VSLDDFALRKRHTYGTLLINLENGKCIDMIETRDVEEVSKWLMTFPNIELVSRDGSTAYKKAITTSHLQAIQITDRFHLIKVLSSNYENIKKFVQRTKRDTEAVVSAILCDYSNAKIEGKINKLKKIKRELYGRCSFELLKTRFSLNE